MREIKFRAWQDGEMIYQEPGKGPYKLVEFFSKLYADNYDVMQYTGLKDKNGVEIYEGDIVRVYFVTETADGDRVTDYSGVVQFGVFKIDYYGEEASTVSGWYFNSKDSQSKFWDENSLAECNESCVIIGNIHENPELIKTETA